MRPLLALAALACCRAGAREPAEGPLRDELALVQRRLRLDAPEPEGGDAGSGDQARQGVSALLGKKAKKKHNFVSPFTDEMGGLLMKGFLGDKQAIKKLDEQVRWNMLSDSQRSMYSNLWNMAERGNLSSMNSTEEQLKKLITMGLDGHANQTKNALRGLSQWATGDNNPVKRFVMDMKTKRVNWMSEGLEKTRNYIGAALREGFNERYGDQQPPASGSNYQPLAQQQGLPMQPQEWWQQAPQPWPPTQPGSWQPQAWQPQQFQMQQWPQQWPPQQWEPQQWQQMQPSQLQQMQPPQLQQMQPQQQQQQQQQMQQMQQMQQQMQQMQQMLPQQQQMQPQMWQQVQPQMGQEMQPQQWQQLQPPQLQQLQQLPPAQQPAQSMQAAAPLQPQQQ